MTPVVKHERSAVDANGNQFFVFRVGADRDGTVLSGYAELAAVDLFQEAFEACADVALPAAVEVVPLGGWA